MPLPWLNLRRKPELDLQPLELDFLYEVALIINVPLVIRDGNDIFKQWRKEHVWKFLGCCTADLQTDTGRHQLYNLFFHYLDMLASS